MTQTTHPATDRAALPALARHEIKRYARHPLFLVGAALTIAACAMGPDEGSSSLWSTSSCPARPSASSGCW